MPEEKRISFVLPKEEHTRFKVAVTAKGERMADVLREFIREYTEKEEKRNKKTP